jgi:hypothetical protein
LTLLTSLTADVVDIDGKNSGTVPRVFFKNQDAIMPMQKHRGSLVWLIAWLSLGSAVWLASPRSAQNHAKANAASLSAISDKKPNQEERLSSSGKRLKSIERVEVGQRVATGISQEIRDLAIGDPLAVPQWDRLDHEIDSQTWRKLTLVMHTPQGDRFDITLLRPIGWLESCNAQVGSSIHLVVSEQGLDGLADVLAIEPCPSISSGVGRVVTGTFTHVRGGILRIRLAGLAEPLGVTSNHSIYSSDRLDFVPAGELRVGETLRNLDGDVRIESIEQLGSEERVYNLEIHGEHVFRVASSGLLVHNSSEAEGSSRTADIGRKLEYLFGNATGRAHNLERSADMLRQMERIGLPDTLANRQLMSKHFQDVLNNAPNIAGPGRNGSVIRESLLMGPTGAVKIRSWWEGDKLMTFILEGVGSRFTS